MTNSTDAGSSNPHGITNPNRATIGEILTQTFALARENFWFGILVFGGASIITLLMFLVAGVGLDFGSLADPAAAQSALAGANIGMVIVAVLVTSVAYLLAYLAVFARMALKYRGDAVDLGASLSLCIRRFARVLCIALLLAVAMVLLSWLLGFIISIVVLAVVSADSSGSGFVGASIVSFIIYLPLIWLTVRLIPVAGVMMTEDDAGILGSISRGFKLSSGKWWSIFFASLVLGIMILVISLIVGLVGLIPVIGTVIFLAAMVFFNVLYSGFYMGTYFELVAAKGGRVAGNVGAVFE